MIRKFFSPRSRIAGEHWFWATLFDSLIDADVTSETILRLPIMIDEI